MRQRRGQRGHFAPLPWLTGLQLTLCSATLCSEGIPASQSIFLQSPPGPRLSHRDSLPEGLPARSGGSTCHTTQEIAHFSFFFLSFSLESELLGGQGACPRVPGPSGDRPWAGDVVGTQNCVLCAACQAVRSSELSGVGNEEPK